MAERSPSAQLKEAVKFFDEVGRPDINDMPSLYVNFINAKGMSGLYPASSRGFCEGQRRYLRSSKLVDETLTLRELARRPATELTRLHPKSCIAELQPVVGDLWAHSYAIAAAASAVTRAQARKTVAVEELELLRLLLGEVKQARPAFLTEMLEQARIDADEPTYEEFVSMVDATATPQDVALLMEAASRGQAAIAAGVGDARERTNEFVSKALGKQRAGTDQTLVLVAWVQEANMFLPAERRGTSKQEAVFAGWGIGPEDRYYRVFAAPMWSLPWFLSQSRTYGSVEIEFATYPTGLDVEAVATTFDPTIPGVHSLMATIEHLRAAGNS